MNTRNRFSLAIAICLSGCTSMPAVSDMGGPPPLSTLAQFDPPVATTPQTCTNGFLLTQTPHQTAGTVESVRTSAGVWHTSYSVNTSETAPGYSGVRHLASGSGEADSVVWSPMARLTIGPDDVPTLFFADQTAVGAPPSLSRARLINGAWQIDAKPLYSGSAGAVVFGLGARIDGNNHAHVYFNDGQLATDAGGSWVTTPIPVTPAQSLLLSARCDQAGHDYFLFTDSNLASVTITEGVSYMLVTNVGGSWQQTVARNGILRTDGNGDVHLLASDGNMNVLDSDLTAGTPTRTLAMGSTFDPLDARFDANGYPVIFAAGTASAGTQPMMLWSNVGGVWQSAQLPMTVPQFVDPLEDMYIDAQGGVHLVVVAYPASPSMSGPLQGQISYVDPC